MLEKKSVTAVVVTFNRLLFLKECIESLQKQTYKLDKIIIVDNNSSDGTKEFLKKKEQKNEIIYVDLKENIGGAGGFNKGIANFYQQTVSDFVWIMDDDTIPNITALEKLIQASDIIKEFGFLASNVRWVDGSPAKMNVPVIDNRSVWSNRKDWNYFFNENHAGYPKIRRATFVSLLIPRMVVKTIGLPIKDFFIWGDDSEFTERISRKYDSFFVSDSIVIHKIQENKSAAIWSDNSDRQRLRRYEFAYRNRYYYSKKMSRVDSIKYKVSIFADLGRVFRSKGNNKLFKVKLIISGTLKGIMFHPKVEYVN
ncbi:glycosyltransferase [Enterococcus faecium]|uniref:glycosyltransferase family 2 protein n=1 Tax=Enterococcus TaxID=1350 RepID=UPI00124C4A41|nr:MULTISPECIES: glycosyltransferase family 2 protein [Enterococcus]MBT9710886.1 glycosyltransferase [Enterococcus faecium]GER77360.1 glycosyltransferase [Enterococcus sp. FM11-1]HAQ4564146.1 glycosyltransferase [Enterococcus faecium]